MLLTTPPPRVTLSHLFYDLIAFFVLFIWTFFDFELLAAKRRIVFGGGEACFMAHLHVVAMSQRRVFFSLSCFHAITPLADSFTQNIGSASRHSP